MPDFQPAGDSGGASSPGGGSPTATATLEPSSAGALSQPSGDASSTPGPVPYDRFSEVNTKYTGLKWAEGLDQSQVHQQRQFFQWLDADPEGAFKYMEDYLTRQGALKRQAGGQTADERPKPDIVVPETGQKFYSAEAAERLAQWEAKQATQPMDQRLQRIEASEAQSRANARAQSQLAEAKTWPYFEEHQKEVLKAMESDHRLSLEGAYNRTVLPKLKQLERQAVLNEINQKSHASTHNPGSQTAAQGQPASKTSWSDLFKRELAKRGGVA